MNASAARLSAEEDVAVITCARADPRRDPGPRLGGPRGVTCLLPSHRCTTSDLAEGSVGEPLHPAVDVHGLR